jgi:hypothetical protein
MAPRKNLIKKKAATTSKSKITAKTKVAPVVDPLAHVDKLASESKIAILGERRDNVVSISKEKWDFDLATIIPKLLLANKDQDVFLSGGSPQLSLDASKSRPFLLVLLVPRGKTPPPFLVYSVKEEMKIEPLSKHKLSWCNVAPRVSVLKSTKRTTQATIRAMTDDPKAMEEEHWQLWTLVPSRDLKLNKNGKLDIRFVNFSVPRKDGGEPIPGHFEKGDGLQEYIEMFVDSYGDEIGDDAEEKVKAVIQEAFNAARKEREDQAKILNDAGFDDSVLEAIQAVKIYPKGTEESEKSAFINKYFGKASTVY